MDCYRCLIQWGINTGGAVRTSTLPIPFTNVFLAVASTSSEWCCPGCSATNTTVTTRAYQSNRPDVAQPNDVNWIIIGCQPQWGICSQNSFQSVYEWGFPISFQKETLAVSAQYYRNQSTATLGNGALLVDAISPFSVTLRLWDSRDVFIIAIGQ